MTKIVIHNHLYVNHPHLGWLLLGSWGWQRVTDPTSREDTT